MDTWQSIIQGLDEHMSWSRGVKNWPLQMSLASLFGRRSGTRPWELCTPGDSERKGEEQTPWAWTRAVCVTSVFIFLWRVSTGWQSLKCTSHPLMC